MAYEKKDSTGSCIRKFVVNLTRPSDFKGEYGFSSVEPALVNKIMSFRYIKQDGKPIKTYADLYLEKLKSKVISKYKFEKQELIDFFSDGSNESNKMKAIEGYKKLYNSRYNCSPWGFNYLTTYSTIFPKGNINGFPSEIALDIELSQLTIGRDDDLALNADGTIIDFISDNKNIIISPSRLNIGQLLSRREKKVYDPNDKDESKYFYLSKKILKIKCVGVIDKACVIKIMASRNGIKKQVGLHVVVKNDKVKKAKIKIIDVVSDASESIKYGYKELEKKIKYQCLNQAYIVAEISYEKFILNNYLSKPNVLRFVKDYPKNQIIDEQDGLRFYFDYFPELKKVYQDCRFNNNSIDNNGDVTYLFRTILEVDNSERGADYGIGVSAVEYEGKHPHHLSSCIVSGNSRYYEPMHELCHSFGLMHFFEKNYNYKNRPTVIQGYTSNLMDYREDVSDNRNKFYNKMYSLEFWQWIDLMKDKNLR